MNSNPDNIYPLQSPLRYTKILSINTKLEERRLSLSHPSNGVPPFLRKELIEQKLTKAIKRGNPVGTNSELSPLV